MAKISDGFGYSGNGTLVGTDEDDVIVGYHGSDVITGGKGRDVMYGGAPNQFLYPSDTTDGISGYRSDREKDVFVFNAGDSGVGAENRDLIRGFERGLDKIDLSSMGPDVAVLFENIGDKELLKIDADGDGKYEMQIAVSMAPNTPGFPAFPTFGMDDLILA